MQTTRQAHLFQKYLDRTATEEEKTELMEWVSREEHADEVRTWMDKAWEAFPETGEMFSSDQSQEMLLRILASDLPQGKASRSRGRGRFGPWFKVAAAAVILAFIATGGYLWHRSSRQLQTKTVYERPPVNRDIPPGGNKAILTLSNGATIVLDSARNGALTQQGNTKVIKLSSGQLVYKSPDQAIGSPTPETFNNLTVPSGGEYQLTLPDQSKVWLNAGSSLRFPTTFTGHERKVELRGEGYFEITKNSQQPFYVVVSDHQSGKDAIGIKVLGTNFNVNAYSDERSVKTTLLAGAVQIVKGQQVKVLKPGQQARIDREKNNIEVIQADMEEVLAWKNGLFHFDGDDMAGIMRKIARWYDIKVTYEGPMPTGHFTGIISRDTNLSKVLRMLELSGVHFKVEGHHLTVY